VEVPRAHDWETEDTTIPELSGLAGGSDRAPGQKAMKTVMLEYQPCFCNDISGANLLVPKSQP